jgi:Ca-activated chloride channel family protein
MLLFLVLLIPATALAQGVLIVEKTTERIRLPRPIRPPWPHPPIPRPEPQPTYAIDSLEINTKIEGQVAQVQVSQAFVNESKRTLEVSFVFPLPYDGAIDQLTLMVDGKELSGKLLSAEEARKKYEEIVRKNRDPALLEWIGTGMYKTSVFPVPAGEKRTVMLRYTQLCPVTDGLADLRIPLATAKYTGEPLKKLKIRTTITGKEKIGNVYSPTHEVKIKRPNKKTVVATYSKKKVVPSSDYRLLFSPSEGSEEEGLSARVISYRPDDDEDGYFLMLLSPKIQTNQERIPKTILFVIDKSGSMSGKKVEQARAALKFVLQNLDEKDLFNIVAYDTTIQTFKPELQRVDKETLAEALGFVETIYAGGGTNINEALQVGMKNLKDPDRPNYVVFLTDGLPTAGERNEMKIVENCVKTNKVGARLFPFGVGYDVNARLLDRLARKNHGLSEYVLPSQDIEEHISRLYRRIESPVLTEAKLAWKGKGGKKPKVNRLYPKGDFDLFAGEQLVLVGRYHKDGKGKLTIKGEVGDEDKTYRFPYRFVEESDDDSNAFVAKLWAVRRVGELLDELDLNGKNQELIDELVELATKHGIVTPYTSFLADETTDLHDKEANAATAGRNLRLLENVDGESGVAQRHYKGSMQNANMPAMAEKKLDDSMKSFSRGAAAPGSNMSGRSWGMGGMGGMSSDGKKQSAASIAQKVQTIGSQTFFYRNNQWVDTSVTAEQEKNVKKIKQFSDEYFKLIKDNGRSVAQYLVFDEAVLLNVNGQAYLIEPVE